MESLVLYALPLVCRVSLTPPTWRMPLSISPLLVVLPTLVLPRLIRSEEWEHVARHALYALAFTASAVTSVRWDVVLERDEAWRWPLVAYLGVGAVALWWFCLSHILENRWLRELYTHQGDVAVLPLTLVAIATFAAHVPDAAFQWSRAILFYVPITVAWATLMFVAYNGFATCATTTHTAPGFRFLATRGLVIASAHLTLLEVRAPPLAFQFLPIVAATLCQVTPRPTCASSLWPRAPGVLVAAALGAAMDVAVHRCLGVYGVATAGCTVARLCVPVVAGRRWVLPATMYAALLTAAVLHAMQAAVRPVDVVGLVAGYYVALSLAEILAPAVRQQGPPASPPADPNATPQRGAPWWTPAKLLRCDCALPARRRYGDETPPFAPPHPDCPPSFAGVWWMEGNTYPMHLICVHSLRWRDGKACLWNRRHITRSATVGGLLLHLGSWLVWTHIDAASDGAWIRTDASVLGLRAHTYWLYRLSADEMLRLVYNADGRVVWQYRMKRIQRADGSKTRFHAAFVQSHGGQRYWLV